MRLGPTIALIVCFRTSFIGGNGTNVGTSSRFWNNNCFFATAFTSFTSFASLWGEFSTSTFFLSSENPAPSFPFKSFYKVRMKKELDKAQYGRKIEGRGRIHKYDLNYHIQCTCKPLLLIPFDSRIPSNTSESSGSVVPITLSGTVAV